MADINEVIDIMVANGEPQEKIMEVINDYNKSTKEPDSTDEKIRYQGRTMVLWIYQR